MQRNHWFKLIGMMALAAMTGCAGKVSKPEAKASAPTLAKTNLYEGIIRKAAAEPVGAVEGKGWKPLFDGRSLAGWNESDFSGRGQVDCESGLMVLNIGSSMTGVTWTNDVPKVDYEITLEAMRVEGSDFFCGLTFPVKDSFCSLILGGWGGSVVGLSSIEGQDASENETTQFVSFQSGRWYHVRVRVTAKKIEAWLDDKQIVNLILEGRTISLRFGEIEFSKPLGICCYETTAALRGIQIRRLNGKE